MSYSPHPTEPVPRGAKRKYDGKVELTKLSRFTYVRQIEPQLNLYTTVVWHVSLKRIIRIALLVDTRTAGKTGYALLFSTDVELDGELIWHYYKASFQIEMSLPLCPHKRVKRVEKRQVVASA